MESARRSSSRAAATGSGRRTIPAPPPYGASSTLRCRPRPQRRRSCSRISARPRSRVRPGMLSDSGPSSMPGKRQTTSISSVMAPPVAWRLAARRLAEPPLPCRDQRGFRRGFGSAPAARRRPAHRPAARPRSSTASSTTSSPRSGAKVVITSRTAGTSNSPAGPPRTTYTSFSPARYTSATVPSSPAGANHGRSRRSRRASTPRRRRGPPIGRPRSRGSSRAGARQRARSGTSRKRHPPARPVLDGAARATTVSGSRVALEVRARCPAANRSSGRSVRTSTRTAPWRPCRPRTRPTTSRVGSLSAALAPATRAQMISSWTERALAGRGHLEQRPQRLRDAAVAPDDLAHVVLGDMQLDDGSLLVLDLGDLDGLRVVDERLRDVLDEILRAHFAAYFFSAGRTPAARNRRATVSDGRAPLASQAFALSASTTNSTGSLARVVVPERLDRAAVARAAGVGHDDPIASAASSRRRGSIECERPVVPPAAWLGSGWSRRAG